MLRRVTFTVGRESGCEHSITIGRSEGCGAYCYADEAEAEIELLRRDLLAAREDADRLALMLTGWCPDGCKGIRLTDGDLLWSGCECLGEDCDCPQHCYPSEQEITEALAAHEAMGGGE